MKYTVWRALNDEGLTSVLLDIARAHVKLALEYSGSNTLPSRKEVIKAEIQRPSNVPSEPSIFLHEVSTIWS